MQRLMDLAVRVVGWCSSATVFVMMALIVFEVAVRKLFAFSVIGTVEIVSAGMVIVAFLAWSCTESADEHVRVEFLVSRLGRRVRLWLDFFITLLVAVIAVVLIWQSTGYALDALRREMLFSTVAIPVFPFRLIVPIGMFIFFLQMILKTTLLVNRLRFPDTRLPGIHEKGEVNA